MTLALSLTALPITAQAALATSNAATQGTSAYRPIEPKRLAGGQALTVGTSATLTVPQLPAGTTGVLLNVTGSRAEVATTIAVNAGSSANIAAAQLLTVAPGEAVAQQVSLSLPASASGKITLSVVKGGATVWADLHGYYLSASSPNHPDNSLYVPEAQSRTVSKKVLAASSTTVVTLPDVPANATAVSLNVTSSHASSSDYISVCPAGQSSSACAKSSTLNPLSTRARQNFVTVKLGGAKSDQVQLYNNGGRVTVDIDVHGYYRTASTVTAGGVPELGTAAKTLSKVVVKPNGSTEFGLPNVPAKATGVILGLKVTTAPWRQTSLSVCPGQSTPVRCKATAALTASPDALDSNTVVVPLSSYARDKVTLFNSEASIAVAPTVIGYIVPPAQGTTPGSDPTTVAPPTVTPTKPEPSPSPSTTLGPPPTTEPSPEPTTPSPEPTTPKPEPTTPKPEPTTPKPEPTTPKPEPTTPEPTTPPSSVPGAHNTGVPAGTKLTVHEGDLVITKAGTVIDSMDIRGLVHVAAPDVTIKRSILRGRPVTTGSSLVNASSPLTTNLLIEDTEFSPTEHSPYINGIYGYGFTLRRVNIHHVIDSVHIFGDNVTVENSWLHDNLHYEKDPNFNGNPSHDDSIQIQIGKNIRIVGNNISGVKSAVMQITQDRGTVANVQFIGNVANNGACTLNIAQKKYGPIQGLVITDNVFGRDTKVKNCAIVSPPTTPLVNERNFFTDGAPVRVTRGA